MSEHVKPDVLPCVQPEDKTLVHSLNFSEEEDLTKVKSILDKNDHTIL